MAADPDGPVTVTAPADVTREDLDGAVAELTPHDDGTVTADIRIPGPPAP